MFYNQLRESINKLATIKYKGVTMPDCGSECRGFESLQSPKRKRNFSNDFPLFCYISSFWGD
nr:MAG TPA: hypothetical protein [Caudoviricetes sp.]